MARRMMYKRRGRKKVLRVSTSQKRALLAAGSQNTYTRKRFHFVDLSGSSTTSKAGWSYYGLTVGSSSGYNLVSAMTRLICVAGYVGNGSFEEQRSVATLILTSKVRATNTVSNAEHARRAYRSWLGLERNSDVVLLTSKVLILPITQQAGTIPIAHEVKLKTTKITGDEFIRMHIIILGDNEDTDIRVRASGFSWFKTNAMGDDNVTPSFEAQGSIVVNGVTDNLDTWVNPNRNNL